MNSSRVKSALSNIVSSKMIRKSSWSRKDLSALNHTTNPDSHQLQIDKKKQLIGEFPDNKL